MQDQAADETPSPFGDWLERTARSLGYTTDAALAKALGTEQSNVSRWKKKATSRPSIGHLLTISKLFGVELEALLVLSGHVPPDAVRRPDAPEPPSAVTATERLISDTDLPDEVKEAVRRYWQTRLKEERDRLTQLVDVVAQAQALDKVSAETAQRTVLLAESNTPTHIADLLRDSRQAYMDLKRKPPRTKK